MKKRVAAIVATGVILASPLSYAAGNPHWGAENDSHGHGDSWHGDSGYGGHNSGSNVDVLQALQQVENEWKNGQHGENDNKTSIDILGEDSDQTVAGDVYGTGHKGLQNALEHVKNPHARLVLTAILDGVSPSLVNKLQNVLGDTYGVAGGTNGVAGDTYDSSDGTVVSTDPNSIDPEVYDFAKQMLNVLHQDKTEPKDVKGQTLAKLIAVFDSSGDTSSAIQAGEDLVSTDPTNTDAYQQLGKLYQESDNTDIKTFVNGIQPTFDIKPFIKNSRTMVPFASIAKSLGADTQWNGNTSTVTFKKGNDTVILKIGSPFATVNGKQVKLDAPATIVQGHTVVPVGFVSDALHAAVQWIPNGNIVDITTSDASNQ